MGGERLPANDRRVAGVDDAHPGLVGYAELAAAIHDACHFHAVSDDNTVAHNAAGMAEDRRAGIGRGGEPPVLPGVQHLHVGHIPRVVPARDQIDVAARVGEGDGVIHRHRHVCARLVFICERVEGVNLGRRDLGSVFRHRITAEEKHPVQEPNGNAGQPVLVSGNVRQPGPGIGVDVIGIGRRGDIGAGLARSQPGKAVEHRVATHHQRRHRIVRKRFRHDGQNAWLLACLLACLRPGQLGTGNQPRGQCDRNHLPPFAHYCNTLPNDR